MAADRHEGQLRVLGIERTTGGLLVQVRDHRGGTRREQHAERQDREADGVPGLGGSPVGPVRAVTTPAMTADPMEPPIVRMFAFIPLATPVCSRGTEAMTTPARLEKTRPEPTPWTVVATYSCQVASWKSAMDAKATAEHRARHDHRRAPKAWISREVQKPTRKLATADGSSRPGLADRGAEAVAGRRRRLQELGQEPERREHAEPDDGDQLVVQMPRRRIIRMSINGTGTRVSTRTHTTRTTAATANSPRTRGRSSPTRCPR